ncbi:hypothetical protein Tco_0965178 [Tanacetum coccineum]
MADENVPAPAPTRSDDQILPFISVDILQNINFFRAFTASASVPAIYIQQFWNTLTYEAKTRVYSIELDESQFVLDANLLRESLEIMPVDQAYQFVSPPSGKAIMEFENELRYTEVIHYVSRMAMNNLSQPWRAILSMINQGLTEFVQAIHTFLTDKANLGSTTKKGRKDKAHRSTSPFHLAGEDLRLGNLKFVPKGEEDEHDQKVTAEKEGKNKSTSTKQPKPKPAIEKSKKLSPASKPKVTKEKPSKASTAKPPKPKPAKEKSTKATPLQKSGKGSVWMHPRLVFIYVHRSERCSMPQGHSHVGGVAIQEPVAETIRPLHVVEGKDAETKAELDKTNSGGDIEILQIAEELGEDVTNQLNLEENTAELDQD